MDKLITDAEQIARLKRDLSAFRLHLGLLREQWLAMARDEDDPVVAVARKRCARDVSEVLQKVLMLPEPELAEEQTAPITDVELLGLARQVWPEFADEFTIIVDEGGLACSVGILPDECFLGVAHLRAKEALHAALVALVERLG